MYEAPNPLENTLFDIFETDVYIVKNKSGSTRNSNRYTVDKDARLSKAYRKSNRISKFVLSIELSDSEWKSEFKFYI